MTKKEVVNEINGRIEKYLNKTKVFLERKIIVLCDVHECEEIREFFINNNLRIDILIVYVNNQSFFEQYNYWGNNANYFISKRIMSDTLFYSIQKLDNSLSNIYVGPTSTGYFDLYEKRDNIYRNADKIAEVVNLLEDDKSINVYLNVLVRLCIPYQFHFYYEPEDFKQYFCNQFEFDEEESYLDAGVCNGINMYEFVNLVNWKYKKIVGIEPDMNNYLISKKNVESLNNSVMINKALYDYDGVITFLSTEKSSKYTNSRVGEDGNTTVECVKGDSLDEDFTFIKMDIEGSEKNALDGLQENILKTKPKLAICIYHFQADFWEVPLRIKRILPEYHFCIRNHQKLENLTETVVYAWV